MRVEFDIFLTSDRNLSHQQNLSAFDIAVIVLVAASNRIDDLRPLVPRVLEETKEPVWGAGLTLNPMLGSLGKESSVALQEADAVIAEVGSRKGDVT